jgi:hypothetical protein
MVLVVWAAVVLVLHQLELLELLTLVLALVVAETAAQVLMADQE